MSFLSGFYNMALTKRGGEKKLPADNGGLKILCSPRSRDFRHISLRYASLFFIPFFPLIWCMWCMLLLLFAFPHQIIYFLCPVLIPNFHPRVCVNVYRFSYGFISTMSIATDIGNLFRLPKMYWYFLLNPIIEKPCCCTGILWNHAREIKPYIRYYCLNPSDGYKFVFFCV